MLWCVWQNLPYVPVDIRVKLFKTYQTERDENNPNEMVRYKDNLGP